MYHVLTFTAVTFLALVTVAELSSLRLLVAVSFVREDAMSTSSEPVRVPSLATVTVRSEVLAVKVFGEAFASYPNTSIAAVHVMVIILCFMILLNLWN